jgi:uncharacterized protein YjbI with pentapeptide repeats
MEPCVPSILENQPVEPQRAPVVPRARRLPGGDVLPLEQIVMQFVRHGERGVIHLGGGPGSGKTTALRHLAAVLPRDPNVLLFDGEGPHKLLELCSDHLIVISAPRHVGNLRLADVQLTGWCDDDVIEYLLAAHPQHCKSIMARVRANEANEDDDAARLGGSPMLWRIALDEFASDESLRFVASAVRKRVFDLLETHRCATAAMVWCLKRARRQQPIFELPEAVMPILSQPAVQALLGAEHLADLLSLGRITDELNELPRELIRETAILVRARAAAQAQLAKCVWRGGDGVPGAASILAAVDPDWTPNVLQINLSKALLERVKWPGIDLSSAKLAHAALAHADLAGADLTHAAAWGADFADAKLRRAEMRFLQASGARFVGADLASAVLAEADLTVADLARANLANASLRGADLSGATLSGACCLGAKLANASLVGTTLKGADLTRADFTGARFEQTRLTDATLAGACFRDAQVKRCDLEGLRADGLDFAEADLSLSLLSNSVLPRVTFRNAKLRKTGLAGIEWEGADLRRADLRGATFHLGSCRSGLVGSAVPCEGSRTGFYTDELDEQQFKSPEEIRKANLCGADLRGAKVRGVDFYLVDLRGARYTTRQARYFRKCGAIL